MYPSFFALKQPPTAWRRRRRLRGGGREEGSGGGRVEAPPLGFGHRLRLVASRCSVVEVGIAGSGLGGRRRRRCSLQERALAAPRRRPPARGEVRSPAAPASGEPARARTCGAGRRRPAHLPSALDGCVEGRYVASR